MRNYYWYQSICLRAFFNSEINSLRSSFSSSMLWSFVVFLIQSSIDKFNCMQSIAASGASDIEKLFSFVTETNRKKHFYKPFFSDET